MPRHSPEVVRQWRAPWPTLPMVSALAFATWRVLLSSGPQWFATTDNPCFFFEAYGLASPDAEFVFPL